MTLGSKTITNTLIGLGSVALFFILAALYFAPQFEGKVLAQHDVQQYEGMCKDILDNRVATGEDAQWTGNMFGGMPAYLINVKYPGQAVKGTIGKCVTLIDMPTSLLFFAMLAMWLATLLFGLSPWVGLVAALAYGFSTYFLLIIGAGHITKMWALVYAPLMMGATYCTKRRNKWAGAALTALFTSLEIGANHPQITYYFAIAMAALWISEGVYAYREKRMGDWGKRTALLLLAGVMAVGSNFSPLWYTMKHTPETTRGGSELVTSEAKSGADGLDLEYATAWSYGKAESFNLLVPDFMGGASTDTFSANGPVAESLSQYGLQQMAQYLPRYYGDQPYTAGPTYLGATAIVLALIGLMLLPNRQRWWLLAATIITLIMSWGNNLMWFTELLFNYLPGYNKFRTLSMSQVVMQWSIPLLAAMAVGLVVSQSADNKKIRRAILYAGGATVALLVIMILGGRSLGNFGMEQSGEMLSGQFHQMLQQQGAQDWIKKGMHEQMAWGTASAMADERAEAMSADAWRSLMFVLLTLGVLWLYNERKLIKSPVVLCVVVAAIVGIDLINVDTRYLGHKNFVEERTAQIQPTAADKQIMADKDLGYRVFNLTVSPFNDATTSYFHRSVGGYHGAKLSRYQDIIDRYLSTVDEGVMDMLNVRYVISEESGQHVVIPRETANGAAWSVKEVLRVSSPSQEIDLVGRIDTKREAVISEEFLPENFNLADAEVKLVEYRPNYLRYESQSEGNSLVVFSEIFTREGWSVKIDGVDAKPLRADYILRAVEVPAGKHIIEWQYRAPKWALIDGITMAFSLAVLAAFAATIIVYLRNLRNEKRQENKA